jgi:uncharacterized protein (TIGR02596 family)
MRRSGQQAFTLVELLVVLGIIAILAVLTVPAVLSSIRGSQLSQAAQQVVNEVDFAHRTALTQNRTVEVRFYQFARAGMPGEVAATPATGKFRAVQCFQYDASGNATQLDKVQMLPGTIIMDSNSTLSSLLGASQAKATSSWTAGDPKLSLPVVGTSYNVCAFDFQGGGATTLSPIGTQWFITLHSSLDGDNLAALPKNFFTLQIDALNGRMQSFRP